MKTTKLTPKIKFPKLKYKNLPKTNSFEIMAENPLTGKWEWIKTNNTNETIHFNRGDLPEQVDFLRKHKVEFIIQRSHRKDRN